MTDEELTSCYRTALAPLDPNGAAVLADLARLFHIGTSTRRDGEGPQDMAFREGQRAVVLYIFSRVSMPLVPGQRGGV